MSLWFLLVCHSLTQKWCGVASWHVSVNFTKAITKTHVLTKSLYIKTWFVCLNKFECLKNVETFQAPKHDSWCLPQICWQLWFWMPFRTLLSPSSLRDKNELNFSDQCQTKFLLPKSQNEFYDLLTIPSCTSSTTTKAKGMENMLIFHVTLRIQILTVFSVQSKYSKKTKSILLLGFVISNKTCRTWNVQIQIQPSRLSSSSRWKPNSLLPMQKIPNGFISPQMSDISSQMSYFHTPFWDELHSMYSCNPSRLQHISPKFDR